MLIYDFRDDDIVKVDNISRTFNSIAESYMILVFGISYSTVGSHEQIHKSVLDVVFVFTASTDAPFSSSGRKKCRVSPYIN